jgi:ATP-dependent helicase/nuclease subunit B
MITFLEETLIKIKEDCHDISKLTIILPSKRACGFLLNYLKANNQKTNFAPKIISIEEFIEEVSSLKIIDSTELLFESYKVYLKTAPNQDKDSFDVYSTWANTLLNDFNEIDRYLIPTKPFFNYLSSIQDINCWYVQHEKTELIENYLKFWNSLSSFYETLKKTLLKNNVGYQGIVYREAAENIEHYKNLKKDTPHVFIGFNALNNAEQTIIQELLEDNNAKVYWDVDEHFFTNESHSASYFLRKYFSEWNYYKKNQPKFISTNFNTEKNFRFIEAQKNISQVKYVGELLSKLSDQELKNTAVVLADENLLNPLLQSLPTNVKKINITMGVTLKTFPITVFFSKLLMVHENANNKFYYKEVIAILNHPIVSKLYPDSAQLIACIAKNNLTYLSFSILLELSSSKDAEIVSLLFKDWKDNSSVAIKSCVKLILQLKTAETTIIERVTFYQVYTAFLKIESLNNKFEYFNSIKTVQKLFSEIVATTTLDYQGDAYNGLQIMGVLETRVLDFKNIIMISVNEGILPSGKSNNSFITYDLKKEYNLPTYTEKDAIYTYHFYRLLHRAKNITLLYNNFSDGLSTGEKSRFITQLKIDQHPRHLQNNEIISPIITVFKAQKKSVIKTKEVMERLQEIAKIGFSPSALTSYMRNPIDFYYQKILEVKEFKEIEETVAAKTLGTIVHDALEFFYKPFEGQIISTSDLNKMKLSIDLEIEKQFQKSFKGGNYKKGKNLIIFEVAKHFVLNFINFEITEIKKGNEIKIISIESNLSVSIPIPELDFPVNIHGKVDRVDEFNGTLRIIDYKTGIVDPSNLEIQNWEPIISDYKFSKIIQVLAYSLMINKEKPFKNAEAGIISFKRLKNGFMKFAIKGKPKQTNINAEILNDYTKELKKLILEICTKEIPFIEKEV